MARTNPLWPGDQDCVEERGSFEGADPGTPPSTLEAT